MQNKVPQATKNRNKWSLNLFKEWKTQRLLNILPDELYAQKLQLPLMARRPLTSTIFARCKIIHLFGIVLYQWVIIKDIKY